MKMRALFALALLGVMLTSAAEAYSARNGFIVQALPGGMFQVLNRGGLSAQNAWCAAGDYAMSVLGVQPGTLIWRVSEPPRPRGASIVFSLSPEGAATSTGLITLGQGGAAITAVTARNMCTLVNGRGLRG
jgi:hypothetical protein